MRTLLIELENSHECTLRNFNGADLAHTFFTRLLLFEEFAFTGNVASVTFGGYIFAQLTHGFPGNVLGAYSRLNGYIKLLTWDRSLSLSQIFLPKS